MQTLTEHQIKEIAEQFDCGFRSFWHKPTATLLFVPDRKNYLFADTELFDEELQKLEDNFEDYLEIYKPDSSDSFEIMVLFTEQLEDNSNIKNKLTYALNKKKPFSAFKSVIENAGVYRQEWFNFKSMQLQQWVSEKFIEAMNYDKENGST